MPFRSFRNFSLAVIGFALWGAPLAIVRAEIEPGLEAKSAAQPLTPRQAADLGFDPSESAALFVGVRTFLDDEGNPSATITEVPYAVDDAIDLATLFIHELNLVQPRSVILALSGDPQKPGTAERLKTLEAEGVTVTNARFANMWDPLESTCRHASLSIL